MARDITVTFEDGSKHVYKGAPDTVTPEEVTARAEQEFARKVTALDGGEKNYLRPLQIAAGSALKGLAGLPALVMDAIPALSKNAGETKQPFSGSGPQMLATAISAATKGHKFGDMLSGVQEGAETLTGAKPETLGERRMDAIVQGGVGALGPGAAQAPIRAFAAGMTGGAGGQAAAELFGDNAFTRIFGSLIGGQLGAQGANFVAGTRPQLKKIAKEAAEGLTPDMLNRAKLFMEMAQREGTPVDLAQALDAVGAPSTNVKTIRDLLANVNAGNKTQSLLRAQPEQYQARAQLGMLELPGEIVPSSQAANAVQQTATQAVDSAKRARTAAVRGDYAQAGFLSEGNKRELLALLDIEGQKRGLTDDAKAAIATMRSKLEGNPQAFDGQIQALTEQMALPMSASAKAVLRTKLADLNRAKENAGTKQLHALDVDTFIAELVGPFRGTPLSPPDPKAAGQIKSLAADLNAYLKKNSPQIAAAEEKFAKISKEVVDPLKQSSVGVMATKRGYMPDTQASVAKLEGFFAAGSDPASAGRSDILTLAKGLNKVDPTAFPNAAKTFISGRIAKAFEPELGGVPGTSAQAAEKVWDALFADRKKWQGMRDMAAGIADAHNLPRKDVVDGLETLAQLTKALKNRPGSVGGLDTKEVKELGGANRMANVARIWGFLPFERVARKIEDKQLAATFGKFDDLLTSPEGALLLTKIGKRSVMDPETLTMLAAFRSTASTAGQSPGIMQE